MRQSSSSPVSTKGQWMLGTAYGSSSNLDFIQAISRYTSYLSCDQTLGKNTLTGIIECRLHRRTVVPIQYIPVESHRLDDFEEGLETRSEVEKSRSSEGELTIGQRACCGSGAYSNVYRVRLDQAHHRLSKVSHDITFDITAYFDGQ